MKFIKKEYIFLILVFVFYLFAFQLYSTFKKLQISPKSNLLDNEEENFEQNIIIKPELESEFSDANLKSRRKISKEIKAKRERWRKAKNQLESERFELELRQLRRPKKRLNDLNLTKSCIKSLRMKGFVLSMRNNKDPKRLTRFQDNWKKAFPKLDIEVIQTRQGTRGVEVVKGTIKIFTKAIRENLDLVLVFEDDATPFITSENKFFNSSLTWSEEFCKRVEFWPMHSPALALGGHHLIADFSLSAKKRGVGRLKLGYMAYSYVVRKEYLKIFLAFFELQLQSFQTNSKNYLSADEAWWAQIFSSTSPAYITLPLLVDHPPGYSATWKGVRKDFWTGKPNWWEIDYWPKRNKTKTTKIVPRIRQKKDLTDEKNELAEMRLHDSKLIEISMDD